MHIKSLGLEATSIKMTGNGREFSGYASVFGGVDSYGDTINAGAYKATLEGRERPVQLRWNHYGPVIGKWVEMKEDDHGLLVKGELTPGHTEAENAYALLSHGAIDGLSIGYRIPEGGAEKVDGVRHLSAIDLVEISVVESPADLAATIGDVKSALEEIENLKELENFLRDAGSFTRAEAKVLISRVKSLCLRDADAKQEAPVMGNALNLIQHITSTLK